MKPDAFSRMHRANRETKMDSSGKNARRTSSPSSWSCRNSSRCTNERHNRTWQDCCRPVIPKPPGQTSFGVWRDSTRITPPRSHNPHRRIAHPRYHDSQVTHLTRTFSPIRHLSRQNCTCPTESTRPNGTQARGLQTSRKCSPSSSSPPVSYSCCVLDVARSIDEIEARPYDMRSSVYVMVACLDAFALSHQLYSL